MKKQIQIKIKKCICGQKPKLRQREITTRIKYWWVFCNCGQSTFATRKKESCTELWNCFIEKNDKID